MFDFNSVKEVIGIIVSVVTIVGAIFAAIRMVVSMNQTKLTYSLLSHDERQIQKLLEMIMLFVVIFFACLSIGVLWSDITVRMGWQVEGTSEEVELVSRESYETSEKLTINENEQLSEQTENVKKERVQIILLSLFCLLFFVFAIFAIVMTIKIRKRERANIIICKKSSFDRYVMIGILIFFTLFFFWIELYLALGEPFNTCWKNILVTSILCALSADIFICLYVPRFGDEISEIRVFYQERYWYLFGMKGDYLLAGDNIYVSECKLFSLIKPDEIEGEYENAQNEHDIYIIRNRIKIVYWNVDNIEEKIPTILRTIACDCEKEKRIIGKNKLYVEVRNKEEELKIKYRLETLEEDQKKKSPLFSCESDLLQKTYWKGNVLLVTPDDKEDKRIEKEKKRKQKRDKKKGNISKNNDKYKNINTQASQKTNKDIELINGTA